MRLKIKKTIKKGTYFFRISDESVLIRIFMRNGRVRVYTDRASEGKIFLRKKFSRTGYPKISWNCIDVKFHRNRALKTSTSGNRSARREVDRK